MNTNALKAETKNLKLEPPRASQKLALSLSGPVALSIYKESSMLTAFVARVNGRYIVRSAKVTPTGFVNIRKLHGYSSLPQAQKKADSANYIFKKLQAYCDKRRKEVCCA